MKIAIMKRQDVEKYRYNEVRLHHFTTFFIKKSLNIFCYAKVDYSRFMNTTVKIALKIIPDSLKMQPVWN